MTTVIALPDGITLRTDSSKFFHVVKVHGSTAIRLTSRDDLSKAVNAFYKRRIEAGPDATVLLVDVDGNVIRPLSSSPDTGVHAAGAGSAADLAAAVGSAGDAPPRIPGPTFDDCDDCDPHGIPRPTAGDLRRAMAGMSPERRREFARAVVGGGR